MLVHACELPSPFFARLCRFLCSVSSSQELGQCQRSGLRSQHSRSLFSETSLLYTDSSSVRGTRPCRYNVSTLLKFETGVFRQTRQQIARSHADTHHRLIGATSLFLCATATSMCQLTYLSFRLSLCAPGLGYHAE